MLIIKRCLAGLGLLDTARTVKETLRIQTFFFRNLHYYRQHSLNDFPLPPASLIALVSGTPDVQWFLESGKLAADSMYEILNNNGYHLTSEQTILDFGCGCGRVLRHLAEKHLSLYGTDANAKLIRWCKKNLSFASFNINSLYPPLDYADNAFDVVYALSVFTHMPVVLQESWLAEMRRILKTSGLLIISTHGELYINHLSPTERRVFQEGNVLIRDDGPIGSNRFAAYHPRSYVEQMAVGFKITDFIPGGAKGNPTQDLYLMVNT